MIVDIVGDALFASLTALGGFVAIWRSREWRRNEEKAASEYSQARGPRDPEEREALLLAWSDLEKQFGEKWVPEWVRREWSRREQQQHTEALKRSISGQFRLLGLETRNEELQRVLDMPMAEYAAYREQLVAEVTRVARERDGRGLMRTDGDPSDLRDSQMRVARLY